MYSVLTGVERWKKVHFLEQVAVFNLVMKLKSDREESLYIF